MKVIKGDITNQQVDAIVNAANAVGIMGAGVAGAITRAGGNSISEEARRTCSKYKFTAGQTYYTKAGDLPCTYVLHAVTMNSPGGRTPLDIVEKCIYSLFQRAHSLKLKTLAIPGLGTKIGKAPISKVADLYLRIIPELENKYDIDVIVCDIMDEFIDELMAGLPK